MIDIATQTALEKTWQDDNVITRSASKMKNALNFGQDFGLGSMIVPFVKTPSNIAKSIVELSPVGFAKAVTVDAYNFTKAVKNGTVTAQMQNKFVKNIGNGIAGVLMYAAGLALAANGVTTGSDDEPDKDIRNFKRNILGVSPYSIKIGDETFTYDWAQPVGSALSITADIYKNNINMDNAVNIITNALATGGNTLFEQSMLSGLSELFGGYDGFMPAVANAVLDLPSQFVPTLSKQAAELTDPYARRTATGSMTDKAVNKVLARIPGASKTLEPVVDVLGRDVKRYGGKNNLFNVFLNIFKPRKRQYSKPNRGNKRNLAFVRRNGRCWRVPEGCAELVYLWRHELFAHGKRADPVPARHGAGNGEGAARVIRR